MDFTSPNGQQKYAALVRMAATSVIGLDFDGTLAPIVDDPEAAFIHPEAGGAMVELAGMVAAVAVITGRPAQQALDLGELELVGDAITAEGKELYLFGQYGNELWTASDRRIESPPPPEGLTGFERDLPVLLRRLDAEDAFVEQKGLAVAIHTRRLDNGEEVFDRVLPELRDLAQRHELTVEPGRAVVEDRLGDEVIAALEARGHEVVRAGDWSLGRVSCVMREPETGILRAAANSRGAQGYAAGR